MNEPASERVRRQRAASGAASSHFSHGGDAYFWADKSR